MGSCSGCGCDICYSSKTLSPGCCTIWSNNFLSSTLRSWEKILQACTKGLSVPTQQVFSSLVEFRFLRVLAERVIWMGCTFFCSTPNIVVMALPRTLKWAASMGSHSTVIQYCCFGTVFKRILGTISEEEVQFEKLDNWAWDSGKRCIGKLLSAEALLNEMWFTVPHIFLGAAEWELSLGISCRKLKTWTA